MNKKKILPWIIGGVLLLGSVSALLVAYFSNTVSYNVNVRSPVELQLSADDVVYGTTPFTFNIVGGGNTHAYTLTSNLANSPISGKWVFTLENDAGISCSEAWIDVTTNVSNVITGPTDITSSCAVVNATSVTYLYSDTTPLAVGYVGKNDWNVTFNLLAVGSYKANVVFLP